VESDGKFFAARGPKTTVVTEVTGEHPHKPFVFNAIFGWFAKILHRFLGKPEKIPPWKTCGDPCCGEKPRDEAMCVLA
jgi:hypothetical protein